MSDSALRQRNRGCYANPFSGVGLEFFPLGLLPDQSGVVLHEAGFLAHNDWWNFPNTLSPFWRLYFNARPGHKVVFPDAEYALTPKHLVLIPDHQLFHSVGCGPVPHTWLNFQVARRLDPRVAIPIRLRPTGTERQLIEELTTQFTGIGQGHRDRVFHVGLALLHLVLSRPELHWQVGAPSEALRRTLQHIEAQHAGPLKMSELARLAGLSVRGFAKAFKLAQGVTPGRFLARVRVREAANLLANTTASLEEIAAKTGFPNRHYLSRMFKKVTGDSPAHFRRQHGSDSN
jgi:AraC-like DNA-binding protein